jgi:hypothetical protein
MPPLKKYTPPKQGDPVFVVIRNGKLVRYPNGAIRTFYSEEHFKEHKKTYGMNFLPTDVLVKYVPEIVGADMRSMKDE